MHAYHLCRWCTPELHESYAHSGVRGGLPDVRCRLVHTGQHYDERMSALFFTELNMPKPDSYLGVGSGSHAVQTAAVMLKFEDELNAHQADLVLVVGDVNSTLACALVAVRAHSGGPR